MQQQDNDLTTAFEEGPALPEVKLEQEPENSILKQVEADFQSFTNL